MNGLLWGMVIGVPLAPVLLLIAVSPLIGGAKFRGRHRARSRRITPKRVWR